jgi:hypothetical protein
VPLLNSVPSLHNLLENGEEMMGYGAVGWAEGAVGCPRFLLTLSASRQSSVLGAHSAIATQSGLVRGLP